MTDNYPDEEGYIADGLVIGFCKAADSITLHSAVTLGGTNVSGYVSVNPAGYESGVGVALKAASTNDYIPVCFYGVVKMTADTADYTIDVMNTVVSATTAAEIVRKVAIQAGTTAADLDGWAVVNGAGTKHNLGMALQDVAADTDEILVLIGGAR